MTLLTDADDLTRLLAEKVMGWPVTRTLSEAGIRVMDRQAQIWEVDEPGFMGNPVPRIVTGPDGNPWQPLERIDHAWMVRDRLAEWGIVTISGNKDDRAGQNLCLFDGFDDGLPLWRAEASGESAARTICLAALKAIGESIE